jgi:Tol biopolymer transport system component
MRQATPLSFSPDGKELLVASNLPGTTQLFVLPGMRQVTFDEEAVTGQFLPDGRILVERDAGGNERTQLYVGDEPLVVDLRFKHDTPHAAGRTLAYSTNRRNGVDFDVVTRDLESGEERTFAFEGYVAVVAISPDGRRIVADRAGERSGDNDLYLCDLGTGEITLMTPH